MRLRGEEAHQAAVAAELRRCGVLFTSTLNGVRLAARVRHLAKLTGLEAGVPDLLIFALAGNCRPTAVEMKVPEKAPKTSRAHRFAGCEPHQKRFLAALEGLGWNVAVGYGAADAIEKLARLGYAVGDGPQVHESGCMCTHDEAFDCERCGRRCGWCMRRGQANVCASCIDARELNR